MQTCITSMLIAETEETWRPLCVDINEVDVLLEKTSWNRCNSFSPRSLLSTSADHPPTSQSKAFCQHQHQHTRGSGLGLPDRLRPT